MSAYAYNHTLTNIIDDDTNTPKTNGLKFLAFCDSPDNDVVTAVLDTIPPISHVRPIHFLVPTILVSIYPIKPIHETKTTINQVLYGLNNPRNP